MNSQTPETDAEARAGCYHSLGDYSSTAGKQIVHIDFARSLELQRNALLSELTRLGNECIVAISGDPDDGRETNPEILFAAIRECLRLGHERNDEANVLRAELARLTAENQTFRNTQKVCEDCEGSLTVGELAKLRLDKERLDWLESNLRALFHERATCSVDMGGNAVTLQYDTLRTLRLRASTVRTAIDNAMKETK